MNNPNQKLELVRSVLQGSRLSAEEFLKIVHYLLTRVDPEYFDFKRTFRVE